LDGVNLLPYLMGENVTKPHATLYWRIDGMWAIRHGDWKLVHGQAGENAPELFDLAADVGEQRNLATQQPERVQELQKLWNAWNDEQAAAKKTEGKAGKKGKKKAREAKKAKRKSARSTTDPNSSGS
jgi:arylsulfatase A-like enzyme